VFGSPHRELRQFRQHIGAERLSAEAGLHSHDEHEIDGGEQGFYGAGWGVGI
jgi:hypothetical protein